jgi:AmiR/NasT family two-component response regulator
MVGKSPHDQQTSRDVHRAEGLVSRVRGLSTDESAEALRERACESGISLHAAALAVLSTSPTDELLLARARRDRS